MQAYSPLTAARAARPLRDDSPASAILADTPTFRLLVFRIAPGLAVRPHRNRSCVAITVLEGDGILSGEQHGVSVDRTCTAGDVVVYAPNELHGMRAEGTELLLMAAITPMRDGVP